MGLYSFVLFLIFISTSFFFQGMQEF